MHPERDAARRLGLEIARRERVIDEIGEPILWGA